MDTPGNDYGTVGGRPNYQELFGRLESTLNEAHAPPAFLATFIEELAPLMRAVKGGTDIGTQVWSQINGCIHSKVAEGLKAQNVGAGTASRT